jgi:sugar phosphate isomerase/epimerase
LPLKEFYSILTLHRPTWKAAWDIVKAVDRPNIGLCLDTFQIAGSEFGDPTTPHGLISNQGFQHKLEMNFKSTLVTLAREVPPEKIYALQISDAYKPPAPMEEEVINGVSPRARWSKAYRPYPFHGGYLPVVQVAKAVLSTGFRGWFSTEVFDGGPGGRDFVKPEAFESFAKGAMGSHKRLLNECVDT